MRPISTLQLGEVDSEGIDYSILPPEELRQAAGLAAGDDSRDVELAALGLAVAEIVANQCRARAAMGSRPTLKAEPLIETFHLASPLEGLVLARRPVHSIESVSSGAYSLIGESGILLNDGGTWSGPLTVSYLGGFLEIPAAIKYAARGLVQQILAQFALAGETVAAGNVRSISIDGVGSIAYQTEGSAAAAERTLVPAYIAALLAPYTYSVVA